MTSSTSLAIKNQNTNATTSTVSGRYLEFSMVAQEFYYEQESVDTINRIIDIHEKYNVPIDIILDDPSLQVYLNNAPEVVERLKNSSVVAVSYHFRPPYPFYNNFDFRNLAAESDATKESVIREYFEQSIDLTTGMPTDQPGSYAYMKEQLGYAPIMGGMITESAFAPTLLKLYAEYGTQMIVQHEADEIAFGEKREGVFVRPETYPVIFLERNTDAPTDVIDGDWVERTAPQFKSIKTHDNDFIATQSAWLSIFLNQGQRGTPQPPFDLSVHDEESELLSVDEREARWKQYESMVAYASEHRDDYTLINAKDLAALLNDSSTTSTAPTSGEQPPIYVNVLSHNEEPGRYPNFTQDENAFWEYRAKLLEFAKALHERGVAYTFQSDWSFLQAVLEFDDGTEDTNGKNILKYMHDDLGQEIDAHAHESRYSYADVAALIRDIGLEPTGVVGGVIVIPASESRYSTLLSPIRSTTHPDFVWTPEIIWGGGSGLHEEDRVVSGVWRPQGEENFFTHSDTGPLPTIGAYTSTWEGIEDLLEKRVQGELRSDVMYTAALMVNHMDMVNSDIEATILAHIDAFLNSEDSNAIQFVDPEETIVIWQEHFDSQGYVYDASEKSVDTQKTRPSQSANTFPRSTPSSGNGSCGDAVCSIIERRSGQCSVDCN